MYVYIHTLYPIKENIYTIYKIVKEEEATNLIKGASESGSMEGSQEGLEGGKGGENDVIHFNQKHFEKKNKYEHKKQISYLYTQNSLALWIEIYKKEKFKII